MSVQERRTDESKQRKTEQIASDNIATSTPTFGGRGTETRVKQKQYRKQTTQKGETKEVKRRKQVMKEVDYDANKNDNQKKSREGRTKRCAQCLVSL